MSNKNIDELEQRFVGRGNVLDIKIAEPVTKVVIELDGYVGTGIMRCNPQDVFDTRFGVYHAFRRAPKDIARQKRVVQIDNFAGTDVDYDRYKRLLMGMLPKKQHPYYTYISMTVPKTWESLVRFINAR